MCYALYLASEDPLPLMAWDADHRAFNVTDISEREESVRSQFTRPNVYYAGSHLGCGCGFVSEATVSGEDEERRVRETIRALAAYLREEMGKGNELELYFCWEGDQDKPPMHRVTLSPEALDQDVFPLEERTHVRLVGVDSR